VEKETSPKGEGNEKKFKDNQRLIAEMLNELNNENPQTSFFYLRGYVSYLKNDDKSYYLACPEESCKKKVAEESVGWRCENCNRTFQTCVPTYMVSAKISDISETVFVNFYREQGTQIMGITAERLKAIKDEGDIQVINDAYQDRHYKHFELSIKAKQRNHQDDYRPSFFAVKVFAHSFYHENQVLLKRLELYKALFGYKGSNENEETPEMRQQREEERRKRRQERREQERNNEENEEDEIEQIKREGGLRGNEKE